MSGLRQFHQKYSFSLGGVYVPCIIHRMPGGVIVGDWGICGCVPGQCVTSIIVRAYTYFSLFAAPSASDNLIDIHMFWDFCCACVYAHHVQAL